MGSLLASYAQQNYVQNFNDNSSPTLINITPHPEE